MEEKYPKYELIVSIIALLFSLFSIGISLLFSVQEYKREVEVDIPIKPVLLFNIKDESTNGVSTSAVSMPWTRKMDDFAFESGRIPAQTTCEFYVFNPYRSSIILKDIKIKSPSVAAPDVPLSYTLEGYNNPTVVSLEEGDIVSFIAYLNLKLSDELINNIENEMKSGDPTQIIGLEKAKRIIQLAETYFMENPLEISIEFITMPKSNYTKKKYKLTPNNENDNPYQLTFSVTEVVDKK